MSVQTYASYRGYSINVQVTPARTLSFHGVGRRYKVSWIIIGLGDPSKTIASFPERLAFISDREAFKYAENRAHTFIDCMLSRKRGMHSAGEVVHSAERVPDPGG
ncbi:hypothetical protein PQR02_20170 [Paraburkholderia sediminicola]|uniref:Uncharacterized protein n=1 Tax=Paraburkholderia rhynchosiae TaxID=487049 RepID=A0ACC7NJJ6_9BURK